MLQEVQHRPATGLQSYIDASPDYELYPVGIASIQDQAKKLAEYGRNGDIYIVHATEGETVIPMEVLNANPKVKSLLFTQMKDMGLDPSAYVVGNQLNSINPVTGVPEFFFSSIFRGSGINSNYYTIYNKYFTFRIPFSSSNCHCSVSYTDSHGTIITSHGTKKFLVAQSDQSGPYFDLWFVHQTDQS